MSLLPFTGARGDNVSETEVEGLDWELKAVTDIFSFEEVDTLSCSIGSVFLGCLIN